MDERNIHYINEINKLIKKIPINFPQKRQVGKIPTQAFSEFLTNREQGIWAEDLIFRAINETNSEIIAVKYGKSDDIVAGEEGFENFYMKYQVELSNIGKRPDILIFKKEDFEREDFESVNFNNVDKANESFISMQKFVSKAIAGLEIRSSSFLIDRFEKDISETREKNIEEILNKIEVLKRNPKDLPLQWQKCLEQFNSNSLNTFKIPRAQIKNTMLRKLIEEIKARIKLLKTQDSLSFTPKVEDLFVIYNWIKNFGVPHFYLQVFFDKAYIISFKKILEIISIPSNKNKEYFINKFPRNQFKSTIHINVRNGELLAEKIEFPEHKSKYRVLSKGRLLFYVTFDKGKAYIDINKLIDMIKKENTYK